MTVLRVVLVGLAFYVYPGLVVFWQNGKRVNWWLVGIFSFLYTVFALFWRGWFKGDESLVALIALVGFVPWGIRRAGRKTIRTEGAARNWFFVPMAFVFLSMCGFLYRPLLRPVKFEGNTYYVIPQIGDAYKHLYVTTAIEETGIPPSHPYFSGAKLNYYYGYYIIPAYFSRLTGLGVPAAYTVHYLISIIIGLSGLSYLIRRQIKSWWGQVLAFSFFLGGFGLDIIGVYLVKLTDKISPISHIEAWTWDMGSKLQVTSYFSSFIWVPQHILAAILGAWIILEFSNKKMTLMRAITLGFMMAGIMTVSTFVFMSISLFWAVKLIFDLSSSKKKFLLIRNYFVAVGIGLLTSFPLLSMMLRGGSGLIWAEIVKDTTRGGGYWLSIAKYYLVNIPLEWGVILFLMVGASAMMWKVRKDVVVWWWISFGLIQFLISKEVNDFGMRTIMVAMIVAVIMGMRYWEGRKGRQKLFWTVLIIVNLTVGLGGSIWEFRNRWQNREMLIWEESKIIDYVKKGLPKGEPVLVFTDEMTRRWAEVIPLYGERVLLSADLFSGGVYYRELGNMGNFFELNDKIFLPDRREGSNDYWDNLDDNLRAWLEWANSQGAKNLMLRKQVWVKDDMAVIPYYLNEILGIERVEVGNHVAFKIEDILKELGGKKVTLGIKERLVGKGEVYLKKGIYFVAQCRQDDDNYSLKFERLYGDIFSEKTVGIKKKDGEYCAYKPVGIGKDQAYEYEVPIDAETTLVPVTWK